MCAKVGPPLPLVVIVSSFVPALAMCAPSSAFAATPAEVDAAIQKARAYLRGQQQADGIWPETDPKKQQFGGQTAIATYAPLAAGDKPQDEHVAKAIAWLEKADMKGTYPVGLRAAQSAAVTGRKGEKTARYRNENRPVLPSDSDSSRCSSNDQVGDTGLEPVTSRV